MILFSRCKFESFKKIFFLILQAAIDLNKETDSFPERTDKLQFLINTILCRSLLLTSQGLHSFIQFTISFFSHHECNVGEVQSSDYPISALTVGYISQYAPLNLTQSPSQSIYHTCLSYPFAFLHFSQVTSHITSSFSPTGSSTMLGLWSWTANWFISFHVSSFYSKLKKGMLNGFVVCWG